MLKQSLEVISEQEPFMQDILQGEACVEPPASCTELPACTVPLPSETVLIKEFLASYSN